MAELTRTIQMTEWSENSCRSTIAAVFNQYNSLEKKFGLEDLNYYLDCKNLGQLPKIPKSALQAAKELMIPALPNPLVMQTLVNMLAASDECNPFDVSAKLIMDLYMKINVLLRYYKTYHDVPRAW